MLAELYFLFVSLIHFLVSFELSCFLSVLVGEVGNTVTM